MNCKSIRISLWFLSTFLPPVRFCEYWRYLWIFEWLALNAFKNLALIWADSNFCCGKEEWFRLQRPWLQRSSASDSNLRRRKEKRFRLQNGLATASILDFCPDLGIAAAPSLLQRWMARLQMAVADAGGDRIPRRRHNPKYIAAGVESVPAASRGHFQFWLSPLLANA